MNTKGIQSIYTNRVKTLTALLLASCAFVPLISEASEISLGYQYNTQGEVLRGADGNCLRSSQWSRTNAIEECDPNVVKQRTEGVAVREKKAQLVREGDETEVDARIDLVVLQAGESFAFNESVLSPSGKLLLAEIIARHQDDYVHRVDVAGYTDEIGGQEYNMALSQRRADAVKAELVILGFPTERISVSAHGSADPLVSCPDLTGDALRSCLAPNRRTEIKFVIPVVSTEVAAEFVERRRGDEIKDKNISATAVVVDSTLIDRGFNDAMKIIGEGCSKDIAAFCGDVELGDGRILNCLDQNQSQLSATCKQALVAGDSAVEEALGNANFFGANCGPDMKRLCPGVTPSDGKLLDCLQENSGNMEKRCYDAMYQLNLFAK